MSEELAKNVETERPRSRIPPPLVYVIGLVIGFAVSRIYRIPLFGDLPAGVVGVALILIGVSMSVWAARRFRTQGTTVDPRKPVTVIVSDGPFRYSRNPMYLSLALMDLGFASIINDLLTVLILIPVLAFVNWGIIPKEEKYLEAKFGEQYLAYRSKVRRWL